MVREGKGAAADGMEMCRGEMGLRDLVELFGDIG